ncbi:serine/threonine phosphatase [Enterococcus faecium]|nr:serine/threonine phosphatase [Enterococcus faecium]
MQIEYQSDVGRRRNTNQDYASVFTSRFRSQACCISRRDGWSSCRRHCQSDGGNESRRSWEKQEAVDDEKIAQWFIQSIQEENMLIYQRGQEQPEYNGMGTTIVAAALSDDWFTIANVGIAELI